MCLLMFLTYLPPFIHHNGHNSGPDAFGRRPTVVESIMGYGKVANMFKTTANTCIVYARLCILPIYHIAFTSLLQLST